MFSLLSEYMVLLLFLAGQASASRSEIKVNSVSELQKAIDKAEPGSRIVVTDGIYTTSESIRIMVQGTKEKPVTIQSETTGGVQISGSDGFVVTSGSSYIIIKGFHFTHKTGTFRIEAGATHCIITRNAFECLPVNSGTKPYLNVSGDDCEISYNEFRNKKDEGQMVSVQGPGGDKMAKRTWIHHNYFYNFQPPGKNNCSAIQIGLSGRSMDSAFCLVEYNLFEKTQGENEGAICHKSCNNIIRYNTFGENSEECSIRHGNKSQIYGNFFISTTGLRFSGDDHLIYRNVFRNCTKAIVCTNGDGEVREGSKLTCHDRPDRVKVVWNQMTDCVSNFLMQGRTNGLGATHINFSWNLIRGGNPVSIDGPYTDAVWEGNVLWDTAGGDIPKNGYEVENIDFGSFMIPDSGKNRNYPVIPDNLRPLSTGDVGPLASIKQ